MRPELPDELVEDIRKEAKHDMEVDPKNVNIRYVLRVLVDSHEDKRDRLARKALEG